MSLRLIILQFSLCFFIFLYRFQKELFIRFFVIIALIMIDIHPLLYLFISQLKIIFLFNNNRSKTENNNLKQKNWCSKVNYKLPVSLDSSKKPTINYLPLNFTFFHLIHCTLIGINMTNIRS